MDGSAFESRYVQETFYVAHSAYSSVGTGVLSRGKATGLDFITQIHPARRLRISGNITPLPLSAFRVWTGMLSFLPIILRCITKSP